MDVGAWLRELGLEHHATAFAENGVDATLISELTNEDLKDLGVARLAERKRLLNAIAELSEEEKKSKTHPPERMLSEGDRRQVTVLFADLSGFTKLSSELGAEDTHALLNRYFETVDGIVKNYGGSIDKHIGDSVMAVFGAPVAHTNDPERAIRAASDIHGAMGCIGKELGKELNAHIGIASGQVVASGTGSEAHREYTVTGDSVNLASRLTDLAKSGETLISEAVRSALSDRIDCVALPETEIAGLITPVSIWRLMRLLDSRASLPRPFVGRRRELRQFSGAIEDCLETGAGQTLFVRGEAGIGKTRLIEEFQRLAQQRGFETHIGLVLDFGAGKGQDAIRALVRSLLGIPTRRDKTFRAETVERMVSAGAIALEHVPHLNDLLDIEQPLDFRTIYDAMDNRLRNLGKQETIAKLVEHRSAKSPLLLRVEDVHWADALVLAHLSHLATTVSECRALLVISSRVEGDPLDQAWRSGIGGASLSTIDLGPLREEEANSLASDFQDVSSAYAQNCIERAGGNPLFLEQLLRSGEETSVNEVPGSVQSIVQARMDNLEPSDRAALQAAAVLGQRVSLVAVRNLIESTDYEASRLIAHALIRPDGEDYLFAHALIREGVYGSLLKPRRQALHRRAAAWFKDQEPALWAEHLERADDPAAPRAYLDAANSELTVNRFERALRLVEQGLAISGDDRVAHELRCLSGDILRELGLLDRSLDAFSRALEIAADDEERCRALIGRAEAMRVLERIDEALELLDTARPIAEAKGLRHELTRLHHLRGNLLFPKGRIAGCRKEHERALHYAREIGSAEDEARALGGLGDADYVNGRMQSACDAFESCVAICRQKRFGRIEVANASMIGHCLLYLLRLRHSLESSRTTIEKAQRVGHHRAELNAQTAAYFASYELGEFNAARNHIKRALEIAEQIGTYRFKQPALRTLARIHRDEGQRDRALECIRLGIEVARELGVAFEGPRLFGSLAVITNDPEEQRAALATGEAIIADGCVGHNQFYFYRDAMEVSLEQSDWDEAECYARTFENFAEAEPVAWSEFYIARGRVLAAIGRGRRDETAIRELKRLRDEAERMEMKVALPKLEKAMVSL